MAALGAHGFPVPRAVEHNRHAVLMSPVDATLLVQVRARVSQHLLCYHVSGLCAALCMSHSFVPRLARIVLIWSCCSVYLIHMYEIGMQHRHPVGCVTAVGCRIR